MNLSTPPGPTRRQAGVAVVIILAIVVLLTGVIVAFFSRAVLDRQTSSSSAAAGKADLLARGALDEAVVELKREIAAGSTINAPPNGTANAAKLTFYLPKSTAAGNAATVSPCLVPVAGMPANPVNVVKRSAYQQPFFAGGNYDTTKYPPANNASAVNTAANPAPDGRFVSAARWNKPLLLDATQLGTQTSQPATVYNNYFAAPDWVLVTRGGPRVFGSWQSSASNDALTNPDYVLGRYAYVMYDESGLLDANQAGFPDALSTDTDFTARSGRIGQLDLKQIPGLLNPNSLITAFRNPYTAKDALTYKNYIVNNTPANPGFLRVIPGGDQTFVSRLDLLNYQLANPSVLRADALQYLATFTREKNAPTFTPDANRPKVRPGKTSHPDPNPAYAADPLRAVSQDPGNPNTYGSDDDFNPSLLTLRNSTGAPVVTRRFALSRLALMSATGPASGADPADIKKYFGLVWDTNAESWIYTSPDGSGTTQANAIKFLKNVPATRQPDFFEMLQAAIVVGSLGRDADGEQYYAQPYEPGISSTARIEAQNVYYHVMQIGANIIDQADADSYPTVIQFGGETIAGIENIPYPVRVFDDIHRDPNDANTVLGNYLFEMWNPHQDIPGSGPVPTDFRVIGFSGAAQLVVNGKYPVAVDVASLSPVTFSTNAANTYRSPQVLSDEFRIGTIAVPGNSVAYIYGSPYSTFAIQYRGPTGKWREYQKFRRVLYQIKESFFTGGQFAEWFHERVDPRTDRFGTSMNYLPGDGNFGASAPQGNTIRIDATNGYFLGEDTPFAAGVFTFPAGSGSINAAKHSTMGALSDNTVASAVYYRDPDNELRPADGGSRNGLSGQPLATGNFPSRPVILNRPFRSVGELGYVFRDVPFKSLDFVNPNSGDLALLDAFCLDDCDVLAGRLNVNTRQTTLLKALLLNSAKQEITPSDGITAAEAQTIAQALVTRTSDPAKGPLLNRGEIVSKFGPDIAYPNPMNQAIKTQRESALRALAGSANLRTWNLMIDVIAQTGRYGRSATDLAAFNVTAERRYWLHVAIDRYTGEIVDKQLERVDE